MWVLGIPGSMPGTWAASRSAWAELSFNWEVCLKGHRPVPSPRGPATLSLFWLLFPTFPVVENSPSPPNPHREPEIRTFWNPPGGHSQRKWTLASGGSIFPVSNVIPWTGHGGQVQGSFPGVSHCEDLHKTRRADFMFSPQRRLTGTGFLGLGKKHLLSSSEQTPHLPAPRPKLKARETTLQRFSEKRRSEKPSFPPLERF